MNKYRVYINDPRQGKIAMIVFAKDANAAARMTEQSWRYATIERVCLVIEEEVEQEWKQ